MTILNNEDTASDLALPQVRLKPSTLVRTAGKASILAGFLLIIWGLQSSDLPAAIAYSEPIEPMMVLVGPRPINFELTFEPTLINGRNDLISQQTYLRPAFKDRQIKTLQNTHLRDLGDIQLLQREIISAENEIDPSKAIWLAIHQPEFELIWLDEIFTISHYTYALESDPMYQEDETISVPGLPEGDLYKSGFIYGGRGILQQGTGLAENGQYITIDWTRSYHDPEDVTNNRWFFKYGIGRPVVPWKTVATHHPDLPQGTQIIIETYMGEHRFIVGDGGLDLAQTQIDVFIGNMTIAEADQFGVTWSRVGIVRPINYLNPNSAVGFAADVEKPETLSD